jgi:lipopolysaccharide/colanic/teichoic acid biosynthesis glycosyltransferase
LLSQAQNPEEYYIREIMPAKLRLNLKYMVEQNFTTDLKIILRTARKIFG